MLSLSFREEWGKENEAYLAFSKKNTVELMKKRIRGDRDEQLNSLA